MLRHIHMNKPHENTKMETVTYKQEAGKVNSYLSKAV